MQRREFIATSGVALLGGLAGCTGNSSPPPRKSNVVSEVETEDGALRIDLADNTWVMSRYDDDQRALGAPDGLGGLNPVGGARAKGRGGGGGRGATGRATGGYSSAPKTGKGRAWLYGGAYANGWYDDHDDEVRRFGVAVAALGVAYLGSELQFQDDPPGPGPVQWDEQFRDPDDVETYDISREGWYRVGTHIVDEQTNHDFNWESIDLKVESDGSGYEIDEEWKVSPRI